MAIIFMFTLFNVVIKWEAGEADFYREILGWKLSNGKSVHPKI